MMLVRVSHATGQVTVTMSDHEAHRVATGIKNENVSLFEPDQDDASVIEDFLRDIMANV